MTKNRLKIIAVSTGICLLGVGIAAGTQQKTDQNMPEYQLETAQNVPDYLTQDQRESGLIGVGKATQTVTSDDPKTTGK